MHFDGSLNFDTKLIMTGVLSELKKISELAKRGEQALAKLTLDGLKVSGEKTLAVLSKIASIGLSSLNASITTATAGLTALAGGMGALLTKSTEIGRSFESSMSQVLATMGKTKDSLTEINGQNVNIYDTLSDKAKELGASTQFSASEVADAFNYMALAGWDVEKQLSSIDGVLSLSAASGLELGATCDIVTDYLSAFGMTAEQSGQMADMMAYAQSNANLTVSALAESWKNCAANMNANGQSIETTTALLSKMADQGFKGSEAGTALTAIVRDMSNSMSDGAIKIGDTSVAVADAEGNYRDLTDILVDIDKVVGGLPETARTTALSTTFTADSIKGMNLLLNAGVDNIKDFEDNLSDMSVIEGFASKSAETMNDNLEGDLKALSSASEGVSIAIYDKLSPSLRDLAQNGTSYLQQFNDALDSGDGAEGILAFASSIGDVLAKAVEDNGKMLQTATSIGASFINALINGIKKNQDKISKNIVSNIQQGLFVTEDVFTNFYNLGFKLVSSIAEGLSKNPKQFQSLTEDLLTNISSTFTRYSSKLSQSGVVILKSILRGMSNSSKTISKDITTLVSDIAKIFVENIADFLTIGVDIIVGIAEGIKEGAKNTDISTKEIINAIAFGISSNKDRLFDTAWTIISAIGSGILQELPQLSQYAIDIITSLASFVSEHAKEIGSGAVSLIETLAELLTSEDNLRALGSTAIELISSVNSSLLSKDSLTKLSNTALAIVKSLAKGITSEDGLKAFGNAIAELVGNIGNTLIGDKHIKVSEEVKKTQEIQAHFTGTEGIEKDEGLLSNLSETGGELAGRLVKGFFDILVGDETGLGAKLKEAVTEVDWSKLGEDILNSFIEGFLSALTGIDFDYEDFKKYCQSGEWFNSKNLSDSFGFMLGEKDLSGNNIKSTSTAIANPSAFNMMSGEDFSELGSKMDTVVNSNATISTDLNTATTSFADALGAFKEYKDSQQTEVHLYLYPNSQAFDTAILDSTNRLIATSGGHMYGN